METIDSAGMREDAIRVRDCSNEIVDVLSKHFEDDPGLAFTTMIFLIVRMSASLNVEADQVVFAVQKGFETEAFLNAEPPNDFVN